MMQDILKFAAALDDSKQKESELVQRLRMFELERHHQIAALRGEVVESRNKEMQTTRRLQDAEEGFEQVCSLCVLTHCGAHVSSVWASSRPIPMSLWHPPGYMASYWAVMPSMQQYSCFVKWVQYDSVQCLCVQCPGKCCLQTVVVMHILCRYIRSLQSWSSRFY